MSGNRAPNLHIHGITLAGSRDALTNAMDKKDALELRAGTITVLVGANGAGKTRFMEMIAGLREPEGLSVCFGDEAVWLRKTTARRRSVKLNPRAMLAYAYACQSPEEQLFMRTVRDELRYSLRPYPMTETEIGRRIADALSAVNWNEDWLERDPYTMSGGERRRTALACLFAPPAGWLLLDEPTAGLDADGHELLGEKLKRCAADGQGVLMISHESDWAFGLADRILLMHADGSIRPCVMSELLANPHWLAEAGMDEPDWFGIARLGMRMGASVAEVWDPSKLAMALADSEGRELIASEGRELACCGAPPADCSFADTGPAASAAETAIGADAEAAPGHPFQAPSAVTADIVSRKASPLLGDAGGLSPLCVDTGSPSPLFGDAGGPSPASQDANTVVPVQDQASASASAVRARKPFKARPGADRTSPIARFDARAVWLTYILVSAAILQLKDLTSIGIAALLAAAAIYFGRIPLRRWSGAIKAIATFTVAVSLFAGFGRHADGGIWEPKAALASLESLIRPLIVMLLGFGLPIAVTPLRLRRSLEQLFARFGRMPLWGTKLLLTITLLLRFVPVLLSEWERFSRIAAARGKRTGGYLRGGIRRIRETAMPFMLSLFRLGDAVTDALESRGVGAQAHPTVLVTEIWQPRDTLLVLAGAAAGLLLWLA